MFKAESGDWRRRTPKGKTTPNLCLALPPVAAQRNPCSRGLAHATEKKPATRLESRLMLPPVEPPT